MIHIKDWVIDADNCCYIVGKLKTREVKGKDGTKKTEEFIPDAKYYTSLCAACDGILEAERRNIVRDGEMTLTEAVQRMERMQEEFRSLFWKLRGN